LLFFTFLSCLFASYPSFCFISFKIKVNEFRKKQEIYQEKFDETVAKEKKTKNKKQKAENKEHINMDFKEEKSLFF